MSKKVSTSKGSTVQPFAIEAARLMRDLKCENVVLLDVRTLSQVCDFVIVATGTSDRQMLSVAQQLKDLGEEHGEKAFRTNHDTSSTWIVVDFVDVVAHLFEPGQREFYDIEGLWSDAPIIDWESASGRKKKTGKKE